MAKSFWMSDQKGNFSDGGKDTFDETKDYIGIRLQQGVPLLDRDWNELEDIRRYQDWALRAKYLGDGTPDDGFKISPIIGKPDDFKISKGCCLVDGFEAVNRNVDHYLGQSDVAAITIPSDREKRTDVVYIDLWISEVTGTKDLHNDQDIKIETCSRHKIEWRVRINETGEDIKPEPFHHHYVIALIERTGRNSHTEDQRTALTLFKAISVGNNGNIGIGSDNPRSPLSIRAAFANQELMNFEDPTGKMMWYINQNIGGNSPGLNIAEAGASDGRLFLKAGGYVGINNMNPQRSLHIEGSEVHSGGTLAGFSFANRDAPNKGAFVESGADGQRWVWYAAGQAAHLWAAGDKLVVDKSGNVMISHGQQKEAKDGDNVGLKLLSKDNGGLIYGYDVNHSIFFNVGQDGVEGVTDFHGYHALRFYTGGKLEVQKERMKIDAAGNVVIAESLAIGPHFSNIVPIYIRGSGNVPDSPGNHRILVIGKNKIYEEMARGLKLTIIRKSDLAPVFNQTYNTHDNVNEAENLKNKIFEPAYFNRNHFYVLTSQDIWEGQIKNYQQFFKDIGLVKAGSINVAESATRPYAAIIEPNLAESGWPGRTCKTCEVLMAHDLAYAEINGLLINGRFAGC